MCLAMLMTPGSTVKEEFLENAFYNNSDGAGFAYINATANPSNPQIRTYKSMSLREFLDAFKLAHKEFGQVSPFLVHFRLATHGSKDLFNVHPFHIGTSNMALIHNGIIPNLKMSKDERRSDTQFFVDEHLRARVEKNPHWFDKMKNVQRVVESIGYSKLVVLSANPDSKRQWYIVNEADGHWGKDNNGTSGIWFSNDSYLSYYYWRGSKSYMTNRWWNDDEWGGFYTYSTSKSTGGTADEQVGKYISLPGGGQVWVNTSSDSGNAGDTGCTVDTDGVTSSAELGLRAYTVEDPPTMASLMADWYVIQSVKNKTAPSNDRCSDCYEPLVPEADWWCTHCNLCNGCMENVWKCECEHQPFEAKDMADWADIVLSFERDEQNEATEWAQEQYERITAMLTAQAAAKAKLANEGCRVCGANIEGHTAGDCRLVRYASKQTDWQYACWGYWDKALEAQMCGTTSPHLCRYLNRYTQGGYWDQVSALREQGVEVPVAAQAVIDYCSDKWNPINNSRQAQQKFTVMAMNRYDADKRDKERRKRHEDLAKQDTTTTNPSTTAPVLELTARAQSPVTEAEEIDALVNDLTGQSSPVHNPTEPTETTETKCRILAYNGKYI